MGCCQGHEAHNNSSHTEDHNDHKVRSPWFYIMILVIAGALVFLFLRK